MIKDSVRNMKVVAQREYIQRVRNRTFVILSVLAAITGFVLVLLPVGLALLTAPGRTHVEIVDAAGGLPSDPVLTLDAQLNAIASGASPNGQPMGTFAVTRAPDFETGRRDVLEGRADGVLLISRDASSDLAFRYLAESTRESSQTALIRQAASGLSIQERLARLGVGAAERQAVFAPTTFDLAAADPAAQPGGAEGEILERAGLVYAFIVLLFIAIITYGYWIAQSVAEEKGSRVMELLVSAATPNQLLAGKVLGSGAAGLTQYAALVGGGIAGFLAQGAIARSLLGTGTVTGTGAGPAGPAGPALIVSLPLLLLFGLYFLLGFALYAGLYAAAGSIVSRQQDAQQVGSPITMLGAAGYMATTFAIQAPHAGWVVALSYVPFFSPFVMLMRVVTGGVEPWEVALSIAILALTIVVSLWFAARVYRAGVLMYGQRPGARALLRAFRTS